MREPGKRGGLFIVLNASFALEKNKWWRLKVRITEEGTNLKGRIHLYYNYFEPGLRNRRIQIVVIQPTDELLLF
jgi:hypothetical protein